MSDVGVAPAPSSAPAAGEVPVNQNPTNAPQALGPQTPNKPPEDTSRPDSRREAIQRAFKKAEASEQRQAARKPAEAKMGHNQPPEPTEREKPQAKPEPVDLRKRPSDQPQPRADHGHFAPRQDAENKPANLRTQEPAQRANPLPAHAPYRDPPQRMADHAKAEWHAAPESVRGEVHRMHQEFARAYDSFRGDREVMDGIRHYHQMAQQHGTTLQRALDNYVSMETKLRNDLVGGLDVIVNNLNLQTPEGRKLNLMDVAWHIVNQTPEQHALLQSKNRAMAQTHQLQQANQRIAVLENHARQVQYNSQFTQTRGAIDQYAETHPRLDELADVIENEIKLGYDLDTAYRRAELLRPATQAAQTRTQTAQTRSDRSISGAPESAHSMNGTRRRSDKPVSTREAVANAIRRVNANL